MKRSAPRIDSSYRQYVSPLAKVRSDTSPTWMPSFSAIRCASSGCERPEKSISRLDGPRSIQCSGLTSGLVSATSSPGRRVSSVVALSTEVALFRDLRRRESSERFGRDIFCYVRTTCNPCVVPDLDRCLETIVDAGPDVPTDLRPLFRSGGLMRIVGRDVAGCDIRVFADLRVADVGEVRHLGAGADLRILDLDEGPRLRARTELRTRSEIAERTDLDIRPDLGVDGNRMRPDLRASAHSRAAAQHGERVDGRIGFELDLGIDPRRFRIDDRDPREHVRFIHARA